MKSNKAFTLIELLVVVLIIGILVAIALPQYQVAVAKSDLSTLKAKTKALAEAINVYILANGSAPEKISDLDISLPDIRTELGKTIYFNDGGFCIIQTAASFERVLCTTKDENMYFYYKYIILQPFECLAMKTCDACQKACRQETSSSSVYDGGTYYSYYY